jgi:hypothetical protein
MDLHLMELTWPNISECIFAFFVAFVVCDFTLTRLYEKQTTQNQRKAISVVAAVIGTFLYMLTL